MLNIVKCQCEAYTIFIGKEQVSMSLETFINKFGEHMLQDEFEYCNCDHCVNHWGVDLCACGSGEKPEECENGHDCCGNPMQQMPEILE